MTLRTQKCRELGHPEIEVTFDAHRVLSIDADRLINYIEAAVQGGERFAAGATIQIGWMINRFENSGEYLSVFEPDFNHIPITFVNSTNMTLSHLRLQKSVCESVGAEPLFPTIQQSAIICDSLLTSKHYLLERFQPEKNDSGWFVGCTRANHDHNDPKNLRRASLYEVICAKPRLAQYLALPVGISIGIDKTLKISLNGSGVQFVMGSYLHNKINFQRDNRRGVKEIREGGVAQETV